MVKGLAADKCFLEFLKHKVSFFLFVVSPHIIADFIKRFQSFSCFSVNNAI